MSSFWIHPSALLVLGALLLRFVPARLRTVFLVGVPMIVLFRVCAMQKGVYGQVDFLDWQLTFGRVDALSSLFGLVMALITLLSTIYGLHVQEPGQHAAAWLYAAGSLGAIFAGDLLTLFVFWELMAFSSVFLIWYRRTPAALAAGYRYLLVHVVGGGCLLAGIVLVGGETGGDFGFGAFDVKHMSLGSWLVLVGFALNAAVPPLHAWLPDAYAEGTAVGSVLMSAVTTKTAVYALCRGFVGLSVLVPLGVVMALYGVVYAVLENDSRRLLAYHVVSQVGFMVTGIGLGSELAINGACAHAFAHIIYKGLLFMGCGAVLEMTGRSRFTELGGLWEKMPLALVFTVIGGLSISAFPLFSGFVSKSMVVAASYELHRPWVAFLLMLASVGTFLHTGLKVPYFIWFGRNNCSAETWARAKDAPWNMNLAMALASLLCVFIGCFPSYLYRLLPFATNFEPYTAYHVSQTLQLLLFTGAGFFVFLKKLVPEPTISLDTDWFYRRGWNLFVRVAEQYVQRLDDWLGELYRRAGIGAVVRLASWANAFDGRVVDRLVDGLAAMIGRLGARLRVAQRGGVQENLTLAFVVLFVLVGLAILLL
ncbi:MAG: Na(+)/H(+) antiporter subunit D [Verrucomicrobiae bacterium]|nr:Na(+)/H(+) antiporter subunit D [Verrucomicrobiae bacterium]